MHSLFKAAPKSAQIEVTAQGVYTIPIDAGIQLVRDLFEDIGVGRLRADRYFKNISFDDVSQLDETDLTEAIAVGLDYLTDPGDEHSVVKEALLKRLDAQFPPRIGRFGRFVYRVGRSYNKVWPTRHTLAR